MLSHSSAAEIEIELSRYDAALAAGRLALLSAGLILRLRPLLQRYALARPNARSSHTVPTPQGGGIAVVTALVTISGRRKTHAAPDRARRAR